MDEFTLNNGVKIPSLGLGVFTFTPDEAEASVKAALSDGCRLIDTANAYMNERGVGRGIRDSGVKREDVSLSTKLWPSVYEDPNAVDATLKRLGTDYVDLLFIHQPAGNFMAGYRQLEKAYKEGKTRAIGISNFHGAKLDRLLSEAEIKPQVIQYEAHPYFTAKEVMAELEPLGTRLMAWYPLGHGDHALLEEPVFKKLSEKYGKTPAQVILRWHTQKGFIVIPGSRNPQHIHDNADIFDFRLTDEEMAEIAELDTEKRYYVPDDAKEESYASIAPDFDSQK